MAVLFHHNGYGPLLRRSEGSLLRSLSSMLDPGGTRVGPEDDIGAIQRVLERVYRAELLRPQPTLRAALRSRSEVLKICSQEISKSTCPLLLSSRIRRTYSKRTRTYNYFCDYSYLPQFRTYTVRMLASRCPHYSAGDESPDALLSEIRTRHLAQGDPDADYLVDQSRAGNWCTRNQTPCIAVCISGCPSEPLRPSYSLTDGFDEIPFE